MPYIAHDQFKSMPEKIAQNPDGCRPDGSADHIQRQEAQWGDPAGAKQKRRDRAQSVQESKSCDEQRLMLLEQWENFFRLQSPARPLQDNGLSFRLAKVKVQLIS